LCCPNGILGGWISSYDETYPDELLGHPEALPYTLTAYWHQGLGVGGQLVLPHLNGAARPSAIKV